MAPEPNILAVYGQPKTYATQLILANRIGAKVLGDYFLKMFQVT